MRCRCSAYAVRMQVHMQVHMQCARRGPRLHWPLEKAGLAVARSQPWYLPWSLFLSLPVSRYLSLAACLSLLLSLSISLSLLLSLPPCLPTYLPACLCAPEAPNPFANQGGAQHADRRRRQVSQVKVLLRHHTRRRRQVSCHTVRLRPGRHRRRYRRQRRRRRRGRRGRRLAMRRPLFCLWRARHLLSPRWWSRLCVLGVWCGLQLGLTILVE